MSKFTISGFADEISPILNEQMDALDKTGIRHIEIRRADGKNIAALTEEEAAEMSGRLSARGYKISALGSPLGKIKMNEDFEAHFEVFRHCLRLAGIFGARYIRMFSFYPPEGESVVPYRDEVMRRWERFMKEAEGTGVTLLHENEKGIFGDIPERCLDLAKTVGVGLIFDPANFIQSGAVTYPDGFEMLAPYIKYMHVKDCVAATGKVVPSGQGDGHLAEILSALDRSGFEGFLSLEPHLGNFEGFSELEPDSPFAKLPPSGERSYRIAADALFKVLDGIGVAHP